MEIQKETDTEFGTQKGMVTRIERLIYGLKSSGAAWRAKPAETLILLVYKSSYVDAGVFMKREFKPNGYPYYKYILCYVDDLLHIGFKPKDTWIC